LRRSWSSWESNMLLKSTKLWKQFLGDEGYWLMSSIQTLISGSNVMKVHEDVKVKCEAKNYQHQLNLSTQY